MNMFRLTAALLALCFSLMSLPASAAHANSSGNPVYETETPPAFAMAADVLIARPLLIAATLVGVGLFVVSLPFTALGGDGSVERAGQALVVEPGKAAFVRCLGCTGEGYDNSSN
ncbi:MAG TPA: multidrug transporter [Thiopseudomonas sp.]|nr:multidrug transporter [Thiopseudomonas sp.]